MSDIFKPVMISDMLEPVNPTSSTLVAKPIESHNLPSLPFEIDLKNPAAIIDYGADAAKQIGAFTDEVLSLVKASDSGDFGKKLASVLVLTKSLDFKSMSNTKAPSFLDKMTGIFRQKKEEVRAHFESVSAQIDRLVVDLDKTRETLLSRIESLDKLFDLNKAEFQHLQEYIDKGSQAVEILKTRAATPVDSSNAFSAQDISDLKNFVVQLEKRISDLKTAQFLALQTAPEIRTIQTNSQLLISKLDTIKRLTIPAWKKQFVLALAINEQSAAVKLTEAIDDTTNALIRENATLLHQNSTSVAESNQRAIVDLDTLQFANNELIQTLEDISQINAKGETQRQALEASLETMRTNLRTALSKGKTIVSKT